jgi:hypothetical protein
VLGHLSPALRSRWSTPFSRQPRARERVVRRSRTGGPPLGSRWSAPREQVVRPFRAHHPRPDHPSGARESTSEARKRAAGARMRTSVAPTRGEVAGKSAADAPVSHAEAEESAAEAGQTATAPAGGVTFRGRASRKTRGHGHAHDDAATVTGADTGADPDMDTVTGTVTVAGTDTTAKCSAAGVGGPGIKTKLRGRVTRHGAARPPRLRGFEASGPARSRGPPGCRGDPPGGASSP